MSGLLKKGWSFIFAILSLMLFPQEKLQFMIEEEPSYWYGELALKGPAGTYVLAKNGNKETIAPNLPNAKPLASAPLRRNRLESPPAKEVRPRSFALYLVEKGEPLSDERQARTSDGESFRVDRLRVQADAEMGIASGFLILIVLLFGILGGAIGYSFSDETDLLADTKE